MEESDHIYVNKVKNGWEIVFRGLNNVEINGNGSYLYSSFAKADVIVLEECNNVKIHGFRFGHKTYNKKCSGNVISMRESNGIIIEKVKICGPGAVGIYAIDCEYSCIDSEIQQCTKGANCSETLVLRNVNIYNNYTELALINTNRIPFEFHKLQICNNLYRKKSFFTDQLNEVKFDNNKHLDWG